MNKKMSFSKKIKILGVLSVFIIILCSSSFYIFSTQLDHLKRENIELINTREFEEIYTYIEELSKQATKSAETVAENITKDLRKSNLVSIKKELDTYGYSKKLYNILNKNTESVCLNNIDNRRNGIILAMPNGILEDYYIIRGQREEKDISLYEFDEYYKNAYNKTLTMNTIQSILTHSTNGLLVMESFCLPGTPEDHKLIGLANYDTLREVYLKEGLDGFKNYQFQAVEYITDTGDIFGQKDVVSGQIQNTYKIIIIQEFNVYDHLHKLYPDMVDDQINIENNLSDSYDWFNIVIILIAIIFIIAVIAIILLIMSIYSSYINGLKYNIKSSE